jgi:hypothetical protein
MVLRANVGDCLAVTFTNLLANGPVRDTTQPATRRASFHAAGMELVGTINDDGSFVGANTNALVEPGSTKTYVIRATKEGTYLANSMGAVMGGQNLTNDGAQQTAGLFGAVNVQPKGSFWYRSQVTAKDLAAASPGNTPLNQPKIDYEAKSGGKPVLRMLDDNNEIIYTDLTAIITGPPSNHYLFVDDGQPWFFPNPAEPDRLQPYREFTIEYHELSDAIQAFPIFIDAVVAHAAGRRRCLRHQLRHGRHRRRDPRQPPRRRPDGELCRLRVRRVLPQRLDRR